MHYWITSSARASSDGGIVKPSALAVLRLMTSSNFVAVRWEIAGLGALEDLVDVDGGMAELVGVVRAIAGQAPRFHIFTGADDGR